MPGELVIAHARLDLADEHRMRLALHGKLSAGFDVDARERVDVARDEHLTRLRSLHEPRGEVGRVSDRRVRPAPGRADEPREREAGRDADGDAGEPRRAGLELEREPERALGVVFVRSRRAEDGEEGAALVPHPHLGEKAAEVRHQAREPDDRGVERRDGVAAVLHREPVEGAEDQGRDAVLVAERLGACAGAGGDGRVQERLDPGDHGIGRRPWRGRLARRRSCRQPPDLDLGRRSLEGRPLDARHTRCNVQAGDDHPLVREALGAGCAVERPAGCNRMQPDRSIPRSEQHERAGAEPDLQGELEGARARLQVPVAVRTRLHLERAGDGPFLGSDRAGSEYRRERIAGKRPYVAAVALHRRDHRLEEVVQEARELLGSGSSRNAKRLGQRGEPGDVREQRDSVEPLDEAVGPVLGIVADGLADALRDVRPPGGIVLTALPRVHTVDVSCRCGEEVIV